MNADQLDVSFKIILQYLQPLPEGKIIKDLLFNLIYKLNILNQPEKFLTDEKDYIREIAKNIIENPGKVTIPKAPTTDEIQHAYKLWQVSSFFNA